MILSSDELEILEYLKAYKGGFVSMVEICRSAGGRKKYREAPHWAKGVMARLVDERLIDVNERGHYSYRMEEQNTAPVVEDYFSPADNAPNPHIVGDDYFAPVEPLPPMKTKQRWVSPQIETILKKAGKKPSRKTAKATDE